VIQALLGMYGGLGLFIFGMQLLSDALQRAAGNRFRELLERLTGTLFKGVAVGTAVTSVIQSSSATTVMVVGLVNAGLMTLMQAAGVIFGANIGTTVTAQIVAFKLTDYALPAIGLGFTLSFFGRRRVLKQIGDVLLGLGLLFLGMRIMSEYLGPIAKLPRARELIASFAINPILGVFAGLALTAIVQSSSATTGLFIALAAQGALDLRAAIPLVLGANIGTCATALLASIGTSVMARRTAVIHLLFNVCGVALALPFLGPFITAVSHLGADVPRQIANAHTLFNVSATAIMLPLAGLLARISTALVRGETDIFHPGPRFIDKRFLDTPALAIAQARKEAHRMAEFVRDNLRVVFEGILANDATVDTKMASTERVINDLERAITEYLTQLAGRELAEEDSRGLSGLILAVKDIERVGDHAESLARLAAEKAETSISFSPEATQEIRAMFKVVDGVIDGALEALTTGEEEPHKAVSGLENELDVMEQQLRETHIRRLCDGVCTPQAGIIFLDVASHFERIGDHAASIARLVRRRA
jgi:phosphate:Na+ symporter